MRQWIPFFGICSLFLGCDDPDEIEPSVGFGRISLSSTPSSARGFAAYRRFWTPGDDCPADLAVGDNCAYSHCAYSVDDVPPAQSAGDITISGGLQDVVFTSQTAGGYEEFEAETALFEGGESLTFEVAGDGEIEPATQTIPAPRHIAVTAPVLEELTEIDLTQELRVTWAPLSAGNVLVSASVTQTDEQSVRAIAFYCQFEGWRGTGTLAAADLKRLPSTADAGVGELWVGTQSRGYSRTGRWEHTFALSAYASANVTFR